MTTTIKFSPSINIIRDSSYKFNYIATPNAAIVFNQLFNDVLTGIKSHIIIGAYGIGKSSFLLATEQTLSKKAKHFKDVDLLIKQLPNYEFINIIGEYSSFMDVLAKLFSVTIKNYSANDILKAILKKYTQLHKNGKGLAIVVDEFGKFLEYAGKNKPESELYFIQQLTELINDTNNNTLFIGALHQDFNSYAVGLNKSQQQEWDKVRGRLKDIVFNEPVEQLLYLAAERIGQKFAGKQKIDKDFEKLFNCIKSSKAFPLKDYLQNDIAKKIFPFDILSAAVLTLGLQKYGQNERSLFTFIESDDYLSIDFIRDEEGYYSIPQVYDYLLANFYTSINSSRNNTFYSNWGSIKIALEKIDGVLKEEFLNDAGKLIKTIGLLNIFTSASGKLDISFYKTYAKVALGIKNPEGVLEELEKFKIIRYTAYNFRYILQHGTDLDIDLAIDEAGRLVEKVTNVVAPLTLYFDFPFISAKSVFYIKGTPRFFQFKLSEDPIQMTPEDEIDGFINLVFAEDAKAAKRVQDHSANSNEAILYCCYQNTADIKNTLFDIQKVKKVIENNATDKAALGYLKAIEADHVKLLNHFVLDGLYNDNGKVIWYYRGKKQKISSRHSLNQLLSVICDEVYPSTPVFKSELINKTTISSQISSARKNLLLRLLEYRNQPELGFEPNKFPPEKSIYLSLLQITGIHREEEDVWGIYTPVDESFGPLWEICTQFLESTKNKERSIQELVEILSVKPFKLKHGFISFWLPLFLVAKSDEYALYNEQSYIPELNKDDLELILRRPGLFRIKAFNVKGIRLQLFNRYRLLLNQPAHIKPNNKIFIQTIKPFLSFYRELPEYAKKTQRLEKRSLSLRQVIASAKDPERTFFEDFPIALGFSIQELHDNPERSEDFIKRIQKAIKDLQTATDKLVIRVENYFLNYILDTTEIFPNYREKFKGRFKKLKVHLLLPHQKSLYTRLLSDIDDKKAWLSGIVQSTIGKPINNLTDEDEAKLYDKIKDGIYELDNLCELSKGDVNELEEDVMKFEITTFMQGINRSILRIPKTKNKEIENKATEIKHILGNDKKISLNILGRLLQDLLKNDE